MKKFLLKNKIKVIFILFFTLIFTSYVFLNFFIGKGKLSIRFLTDDQKKIIKKYVFPYKFISLKEKEILELKNNQREIENIFFEMEIDNKKALADIHLLKLDNVKLSNNKNMIKFKIVNGFTSGIYGNRPGGYLDFHQNNLLILSARGVLGYATNIYGELKFKQIKNNIDEFIGLDQFKKSADFAVRDLHVNQNEIFISYLEEKKNDCWNTSILYGKMNYENIQFKKLFSSEKCVDSNNNEGLGFTANSSGGRIVNFDESHILFSVGEYIQRHLAQDEKSINGKIIKININNSKYEIISMGHRNPQGLYYDKENNFILETEHGPRGGDEINLIEIENTKENTILNYGWAIASYGEHYGGRTDKNKEKYKKYPLHKSHSKHGFIEPLKAFVPSIGISEITKIGENKFVTSSMGSDREGDKSIYFFKLDKEKKLIDLEQVKVTQRVRDLNFKDNKLFLFLEEPSAIGVISFN